MSASVTYLDRILDAHRAADRSRTVDLATLVERALACGPGRPFAATLRRDALEGPGGPAVIAEVKRRSPSRGDLAPALDPAEVARAYARGGASCLSVLTDAEFFGGSPADLAAARAATELPVLRKDFTVSEADVCDARLMGADAVLLIVAALSDDELERFSRLAVAVGLEVLVEVHDERELDRALTAGATVVGVNQRDLVTFAVDHARAERVAAAIPDGVVRVAESGVRGAEDAARLRAAGYDAVLVGESLVVAGDRAAAVRDLRHAG